MAARSDTVRSVQVFVAMEGVAEAVEEVASHELPQSVINEIFSVVEGLILDNIDSNFHQQQTASGEPWPPHAPATVARYGVHPLLILEGHLQEAALGGANSVREIRDGNTLVLGVDADQIEYAHVQNDGSLDGRIPQREYMAISEDTAQQCAEVAAELGQEHFLSKIDEAIEKAEAAA